MTNQDFHQCKSQRVWRPTSQTEEALPTIKKSPDKSSKARIDEADGLRRLA